jgi:S-adenosylmethionine synthetase
VAAGLAKRCLIQIAYAIGVAKPLSIYINTNNTAKVSEQKIIDAIVEVMDLTPRGIRNHLKLDRPIYQQTSFYGHFGRTPTADGSFSWENLDLVDELRAKVK